jgi:hypothetical protein
VLPPLSCQFLEDVAAILPEASRGFEFGSGQSTHALRLALVATFSVEHSAEWLEQTENSNQIATSGTQLDRLKRSSAPSASITKRATDAMAVVPLTRCWHRLRPVESFDLEKRPGVLAHLREARLVLIDSPPNPAKREHALLLALRYAPTGAVIVLDDLGIRATARFAQRFARQNRKLLRFWILDIDHRLGVFLKLRRGRIHSRPSLVEFVGTWLRA